MLEGLGTHKADGDSSLLALELDCCVIPIKKDLKLIQTTDFFYPLIDDPYTMGWITCCNVLSDIYAMGVVNCDNMLLLLGIPQTMDAQEREISARLLMEGFRDCAMKAGTFIRGGQTVRNPWLMVGGVATSVCSNDEFIMPNNVQKNDLLVLTKPLGTQVAVNVARWMRDGHAFWTDSLAPHVSRDCVKSLLHAATMSMCQLNRTAAELMHRFGAHGCTDVTGFGLLGHADNLAKFQPDSSLQFRIHTLPCLAGAHQLSTLLNDRLKLLRGLSPETSGGLLIALPPSAASAYCEALTAATGSPCWVIGEVVEGSGPERAVLVENPRIIEVEHQSIPSAQSDS